MTLCAAFGVACGGPGRGDDTGDEDTEGIVITSADSGSSGIVDDESSGEGSESGDDDDTIRFDVGGPDGPGGCTGGVGTYDFSTIWVANSPEGTVSKIDTRTGAELARYITGPESDPDPSRTSVNLQGDVAVGNRGGSIAKIATRSSDCIDTDGDGQIQTSTGPDDVLAWGEDECVLWHADLPFSGDNHTGGPRAVAWDVGEPVAACETARPRVWVGWRDVPTDTVRLRRLDGQTGEVDAEVAVNDWDGNWGHGSYGGAVDGDNNFWALGTRGTLVRVDGVTLDVDRWENEGNITYGIALDAEGNPWMAGWDGHLTHFDVASETFVDHGALGPDRLRGLAIDTQGYAWIAANNDCGLVQYDIAAEALVDGDIALPGCATPVGVSIDVDGLVWVVDQNSSEAYRVHPETYDVEVVGGLVNPYTYSDMTGAGLGLVVPPEG